LKRLLIILGLLCLAFTASAEVVDSVVATVSDHPIKHSDVIRDLRTTAFLNQTPADFSFERQQEAVSRLIDQIIIRVQLENGGYPEADAATVETMFQQVKRRYSTDADFQRALAGAGLNEPRLESYLTWQVMVLEFIQLRFGGAPDAEEDASSDAFITWLDATRKEQRIKIRTERLK
jgi:hypothetical protein